VRDGIDFVQQLALDLGVPGLASYGMTADDIPEIVAQAARASSMKGNPIELSAPELQQILRDGL
jgi:alcohol dehydrogenase class IV